MSAPTVVRSSWHNIYPDRTGNERLTRRAADLHAAADRVGLVRLDLYTDHTVMPVVLDLATGAEVAS
jgi:hypothetical protein